MLVNGHKQDKDKRGTVYLWPLLLPSKDPLGENRPLKNDGQTEYDGDYPNLNWQPTADISNIHDPNDPKFPLRFPFGFYPRMDNKLQPIFQVKINQSITSVHEQLEAIVKYCCVQNSAAEDFVGFTFFYGASVESSGGKRAVKKEVKGGADDKDWLVCSSRGLNQRYFPLHRVLRGRDADAKRFTESVRNEIKSARTDSDGAVPKSWAKALSRAFAHRYCNGQVQNEN